MCVSCVVCLYVLCLVWFHLVRFGCFVSLVFCVWFLFCFCFVFISRPSLFHAFSFFLRPLSPALISHIFQDNKTPTILRTPTLGSKISFRTFPLSPSPPRPKRLQYIPPRPPPPLKEE